MKIRNISEALLPRPKVNYYIDRMIRPASVNMFHAEPGTGKSLLFISMGICYCSPDIDNWLGFDIHEKGKVLFVQEEMGDDGFLEFLEEAYRGYYGNQVINLDFDFLVFPGLNFSDQKSIDGFIKLIEHKKYNLIFSDSFAATTGDNEDTKKDMQPAMNRARSITKLDGNPALTFTHHPTKNGGGYRGSGSIKAALDLLVGVKGTKDNKLEFTMEKNRYKPCLSWEAQKIFEKDTQSRDIFRLERIGKLSDIEEGQKVMITIIENNPDMGQSEISDLFVRMGGKKSHVGTVLKMLDTSEVTEIVSDSVGGRGKKKVRKLTDAYIGNRLAEAIQFSK